MFLKKAALLTVILLLTVLSLSGCEESDPSSSALLSTPATGTIKADTSNGTSAGTLDGIFKLYDSQSNLVYTSTDNNPTIKDVKPGIYTMTFTFTYSGQTFSSSPGFSIEAGKKTSINYTYVSYVSENGEWAVSATTISPMD